MDARGTAHTRLRSYDLKGNIANPCMPALTPYLVHTRVVYTM